ncbi:hypothetical protein HK405_009211, partial [Cladochytrium tenue]
GNKICWTFFGDAQSGLQAFHDAVEDFGQPNDYEGGDDDCLPIRKRTLFAIDNLLWQQGNHGEDQAEGNNGAKEAESDIGNLEDFYDEMTPEEIERDQCRRFWRKVEYSMDPFTREQFQKAVLELVEAGEFTLDTASTSFAMDVPEINVNQEEESLTSRMPAIPAPNIKGLDAPAKCASLNRSNSHGTMFDEQVL